ncbi:MAG TPA: hypothetical protein P5246_01245 [Candidatus Omnitrophota bacterium]|jgi:hypothetical protein|nr:hypothetical protein [Candidatus Omnitrophota bacterium]HSA30881.1 hypothetical protein [Candidatus Omnitrophota bacterium]
MVKFMHTRMMITIVIVWTVWGCGRQPVPQGYLDETANDVYQAVLGFENASHKAVGPCFQSVGKEDYDPGDSLALCREARQFLNSIEIDQSLPPKIISLLNEARTSLLMKTEYHIEESLYNIGERDTMPFSFEREQDKVDEILSRAKKIAQP